MVNPGNSSGADRASHDSESIESRKVTNPYATVSKRPRPATSSLYAKPLCSFDHTADRRDRDDNNGREASSLPLRPSEEPLETVGILPQDETLSNAPQLQPVPTKPASHYYLPSQNLSFGSAEILTVSELNVLQCCSPRSVRVTGLLLHQLVYRVAKTDCLSLILGDPLLETFPRPTPVHRHNGPSLRRVSFSPPPATTESLNGETNNDATQQQRRRVSFPSTPMARLGAKKTGSVIRPNPLTSSGPRRRLSATRNVPASITPQLHRHTSPPINAALAGIANHQTVLWVRTPPELVTVASGYSVGDLITVFGTVYSWVDPPESRDTDTSTLAVNAGENEAQERNDVDQLIAKAIRQARATNNRGTTAGQNGGVANTVLVLQPRIIRNAAGTNMALHDAALKCRRKFLYQQQHELHSRQSESPERWYPGCGPPPYDL
jgi:hypothetical protein